MSGGPAFNRNGEAVGMVSRSLRAEADRGVGYAVHFGLAKDIELLMPNVDKFNPGWRRCWGVFVAAESPPVSMHATKQAAEADAAALGVRINSSLLMGVL